ncbi:potassium channel family protein [Blastococcus sp. DSM 46786]|uniref:potassium channel family protein n=1 Tax=Blastococcus sp. DSM 46786 TaxID=1798227 RepID=UPI001481082D|nr:potassium channel family protein [Blastococcus sp. DSM 46786]
MTAFGVALVAVALWDLFHTLFHPSGQGSLARLILRMHWRLFRLRNGKPSQLAGPLGIVGTIITWVVLVLVGGALVYWPYIPEGFLFTGTLRPGTRSDFLDAVHFSMVSTSTVGFGGMLPTYSWLRIVAPLQTLIGFALLTTAVTWIMQIYPALTRTRALSIRLAALQRSGMEQQLLDADSSAVAQTLDSLATQITQTRTDLAQNSEIYYFHNNGKTSSLAATLPYALHLADLGRTASRPDVQRTASTLRSTLDDLAEVLNDDFFKVDGTTSDVFDAFGRDHGYTPLSGP